MAKAKNYYIPSIVMLILSLLFFLSAILNVYVHTKMYADEGVQRGYIISFFILLAAFFFYVVGSMLLAKAKGYSWLIALLSFIPFIGSLIIFFLGIKNYALLIKGRKLILNVVAGIAIFSPFLYFGSSELFYLYQIRKNNLLQIISGQQVPQYVNKWIQKHQYPLRIGGLHFLNSNLYISSNIGIFQLDNDGKLLNLFHWDGGVAQDIGSDNVNNLYWMYIIENQKIYSFDGTQWHSYPLPGLERSTRGNVMEGFKCFQDTSRFYLVFAGELWQFSQEKDTFIPIETPTSDLVRQSHKQIKDVIGLDQGKVVVLEGYLSFMRGDSQLFFFNKEWHEIKGAPTLNFKSKETTSTGDKGYIRTSKGNILEVDMNRYIKMDIPALCTAIATTSKRALLASFFKKGIFIFKEGKWEKLCDYPQIPDDREDNFAFLTEGNGTIAFGIDVFYASGRPPLNEKPKIWILKNSSIKEIQIF